MNWNSPAEFFAMGGYALYVWGSFGACALLMVVEPLLANRRRNNAIDRLKKEFRADRAFEKEVAR